MMHGPLNVKLTFILTQRSLLPTCPYSSYIHSSFSVPIQCSFDWMNFADTKYCQYTNQQMHLINFTFCWPCVLV